MAAKVQGRKATKDANGAGSIWHYSLADGSVRWAVQFSVLDTETQGRRRSTRRGFQSQSDAVRFRAENTVKAATGKMARASGLRLGAFLDEWLDSSQLRQATRAGYRTKIRLHVKPYLGDKQLDRVNRAHLEALYRDLYSAGRADHRSGEGLSLSTIKQVHAILSGAFNEAERDGLVNENPCRHARLPSPRAGQQLDHEIHPWTTDEVKSFLAATKDERLGVLWRFYAMTGVRRGEALAVRWKDVDLTEGSERVSIRRAVTASSDGEGRKPVEIAPTKSANARVIDLDATTATALREHRAAQQQERTEAGDRWVDDPGGALVFPRDSYRLSEGRTAGGPIKPDSVGRSFDSAVSRHGTRKVRLHDLRHGWATMALQAGVHPKVVQERMGHSTIGITLDTYSHVITGQQRSAAAAVSALID